MIKAEKQKLYRRFLVLGFLIACLIVLTVKPLQQVRADGPCGPSTYCANGCPVGMKCDYSTCWCVVCEYPFDPDPSCPGY